MKVYKVSRQRDGSDVRWPVIGRPCVLPPALSLFPGLL